MVDCEATEAGREGLEGRGMIWGWPFCNMKILICNLQDYSLAYVRLWFLCSDTSSLTPVEFPAI